MYINDVFEHLKTGIEVDFDQLSIFMLMFADDMILISKTAAGLQLLLNQLHSYCNEWNLTVNVNKTKTVIFCKRKSNHNLEFRYGNFVIDIVDSYVYLGVKFNYNGKYKVALETISNQATRAIYGLKKAYKYELMDIETKLQLFDSIVTPILLYGSEVWGFENISNVEKIQIRFYKLLLGLNGSVSNVVTFGELGKFPLRALCKERILKYWLRLISNKEGLRYEMYMCQKYDCENKRCKNWAYEVRYLLNNLGLNYIWELQRELNMDDCNAYFCIVKQRIRDQFIQSFFTDISANVRLHKYSCFKESFEYEKYLEVLNSKERNVLCRFRCSGHNLMTEKGRHLNIERSLRLCQFCNANVIEDEYHFLLVCPFYRDLRRKYFKNYYFSWPNVHKFNLLMQTRSPTILKKLAKYLIEAFDKRNFHV